MLVNERYASQMVRLTTALVVLLWLTGADAALLCAKQRKDGTFNAAVRIREACLASEVQLDPVGLGLQGPKGEPGVCDCPATTTTVASTTTTTLRDQELTAIDPSTGLMWELKRSFDGAPDYSDPHDADNRYSWCIDLDGNGNCDDPTYPLNGTIATDFLIRLNLPPCFAGHCDWRLPASYELASLIDTARVGCDVRTAPCSDPLVDPTVPARYWSSYTDYNVAFRAWWWSFFDGSTSWSDKTGKELVRAVRGGS